MVKFDRKRLVALREFNKLSQTEFANRVGTSRQHISNLEDSSGGMPGMKLLTRIVNEFDIEIGSLWVDDGKRRAVK